MGILKMRRMRSLRAVAAAAVLALAGSSAWATCLGYGVSYANPNPPPPAGCEPAGSQQWCCIYICITRIATATGDLSGPIPPANVEHTDDTGEPFNTVVKDSDTGAPPVLDGDGQCTRKECWHFCSFVDAGEHISLTITVTGCGNGVPAYKQLP